jgi:hypothetical protein
VKEHGGKDALEKLFMLICFDTPVYCCIAISEDKDEYYIDGFRSENWNPEAAVEQLKDSYDGPEKGYVLKTVLGLLPEFPESL